MAKPLETYIDQVTKEFNFNDILDADQKTRMKILTEALRRHNDRLIKEDLAQPYRTIANHLDHLNFKPAKKIDTKHMSDEKLDQLISINHQMKATDEMLLKEHQHRSWWRRLFNW